MGSLRIGPVVLGAMTFGGQVDEREAAGMVAVARDFGVSAFDTSNNYNAGRSEEILGRAIRGHRDELVLSTKVGSPVAQDDSTVVGLRAAAIERAAEASLRRMATDYIDIYYLHRPDWQAPIEETLEAADRLVRAGKVRHLGQSNYAAWQVTEMSYLARLNGWAPVPTAQIMYNLLARRVEIEYLACSKRLGPTNLAYNPLAGGLLTGKHRARDSPPAGRFADDRYRERYWNGGQFDAVSRLEGVAHEAGMTLVELSLRWLRDRPGVDGILVGASGLDHLCANLLALQGPALDVDTRRACEDATTALLGAAPRYNR